MGVIQNIFRCSVVWFLFITLSIASQSFATHPVPSLLAKRGKLIVDDDGSKTRGGKKIIELKDGVGVKAALGTWTRAEKGSDVWRSTWKPGMGHPPVASYPGIKARNLIVEVTFRYGEATEPWHSQFLRIAVDQRPQFKGHIVSAWINDTGNYTRKGFVLEHVYKDEKNKKHEVLMDHQSLVSKQGSWQTAVLEVVGDESLFRMGEHLAYAQADQINLTKNLVSLTMGTTWHEIKRVRIWHAEVHPEWEAKRDSILKSRKPFENRLK